MAEIRVQPKRRSYGWVWLVLLLLIVAAVLYFLYVNGTFTTGTTRPVDTTMTTSFLTVPFVTKATGGTHGTL